MLGRLFKQQSSQPHGTGPAASAPGPVASPTFSSYEDPYTREILYGTHNPNQLKPYAFNNQLFRIIVSQDGGNLRSKQVLFDSANEPESPGANSAFCKSPAPSKHTQHHRHMIASKVHHNTGELNDYMFGCGLPTNQTRSSTKIHILPALNSSVYGSSRSVLITRLFSITDMDAADTSGLSSVEAPSSSWDPTPTLLIKESSIRNHPFAKSFNSACNSSSSASSKSSNNVNSRFAIGIIIPLESLHDIGDIVFNNWNEISHYLILLQRFTTKKLIHELNAGLMSNLSAGDSPNSCPCPYIVNKRIQFPSNLLQADPDLSGQLYKLIKLVHYNANVPKLICANNMIRSCIMSKSTSYNSMMLNWVLEVINWLEFKDGKSVQPNTSGYYPLLQNGHNSALMAQSDSVNSPTPGNTFLASLLALILPLRESLSTKPFFNAKGTKTRELTRIVIMTGNPVVAKKLIFIINALIPNNIFSFSISSFEFNDINDPQINNDPNDYDNRLSKEIDTDDEVDPMSRESSHERKLKSPISSERPSSIPTPNSRILSQSPRSSSISSSRGSPVLTSSGTKPIPIQASKYSSSPGSSDNSLVGSTPSAKGWEIPRKSRVTTTAPKSRVETSAQIAPISVASNSSKERQNSLSKSSSMSQLSMSLNSSLSQSSNYSLSKLGGSFMEKWKNSFGSYTSNNSNPSNTFTNSQMTTGSSFNSSVIDSNDYFPPNYSGSLSKRNSVQSLRTPSPAVEYDEFSWHTNGTSHHGISSIHPGGIQINNMGGNTVNGHLSSSIGGVSMTPTKLSRTQSMFDLFNMHNGHQNNTVREESVSVPGIASNPKLSLEVKRSKTGVYSPLINDNMVKNVSEHNKNVIKMKCTQIMDSHLSLHRSDEATLEVNGPPSFTNGDSDEQEDEYQKCFNISQDIDDVDEMESFVNDQSTITSNLSQNVTASFGVTNDQSKQSRRKPNYSIYKQKPLLPAVAFSDEFRPEYTVQSCPINPKLESQVSTAMKNDLLFYQGNGGYEEVISRTIFISLRAREIKVIEMSFNDSLDPGAAVHGNGVSSPESLYQRRNSATGARPKNTYKTKIKKVYTPSKNSGDKEYIDRVERVLDGINQAFVEHQKDYNGEANEPQRGRNSCREGLDLCHERPGECTYESFTKKLSSLVLRILE